MYIQHYIVCSLQSSANQFMLILDDIESYLFKLVLNISESYQGTITCPVISHHFKSKPDQTMSCHILSCPIIIQRPYSLQHPSTTSSVPCSAKPMILVCSLGTTCSFCQMTQGPTQAHLLLFTSLHLRDCNLFYIKR